MNSNLISWASSYNGLDNVPCDLTVAGYTSEEKNQILQAYKDYLGDTPPPTGSGDILPGINTELDNVNALNVIISNYYMPEIIDLIPFVLGWASFDNLPDIANFLKDYTAPVTEDVKKMLGLAANVTDKIFLNEILDLVKGDEDIEAIQAGSMALAAHNNSSLYGPYDLAHHTKINPYTEANIIDPTLLVREERNIAPLKLVLFCLLFVCKILIMLRHKSDFPASIRQKITAF